MYCSTVFALKFLSFHDKKKGLIILCHKTTYVHFILTNKHLCKFICTLATQILPDSDSTSNPDISPGAGGGRPGRPAASRCGPSRLPRVKEPGRFGLLGGASYCKQETIFGWGVWGRGLRPILCTYTWLQSEVAMSTLFLPVAIDHLLHGVLELLRRLRVHVEAEGVARPKQQAQQV